MILNSNTPRQTFKNLSGVSLCFLWIKYCLSVGAFFERPRAHAVRPYHVLDDFFAIFARLSQNVFCLYFKYEIINFFLKSLAK